MLKVAIIVLMMTVLVPRAHCIIYPKSSAPNGYYFYPYPNDTIGASMWLADVYKFYEAISLRTDSIKPSLTSDMQWGVDSMLRRQVPGFGFLPSSSQAPQLYTILRESYDIFGHVSSYKSTVKRVRPCRRLREATFGVENADAADFKPGSSSEFSFPSSHASASWGIALLLTCVNPWKADTIINRGLAHSQSRVIGGVHWQSDVDAGKILCTANYARIYSYDSLLNLIDVARSQTLAELGRDVYPTFEELYANDDTLSLLTQRLPGPYDMSSPVGSCDMGVLVDKMSNCTSSVVTAAKKQVDLSTANILSCFSSQMGKTITSDSHPAIYALVDMHLRMCRKLCEQMQDRYDKPLPYEVMHVSPLTEESVASLSADCYPSLHSALGWTASLALMMMRPSNQNAILKQGVAFGENRVATGCTWPSDVEMGRLVASIAFGYVTSCREYTDMVRAALAEFNSK